MISKSRADEVLSKLNTEDITLDDACCGVKVVLVYPSTMTVKGNFDPVSAGIIKNICRGEWATVVNAIRRHEFLAPELLNLVEREVGREFAQYSKSDSCLKECSPDQLRVFSNKTLCEEVRVFCPLFYAAVGGACDMRTSDESDVHRTNALALATSALARCRNPTMSAVAYRISALLYHSGLDSRGLTRLNNLGVCMSPKRMISLQEKMADNFDYKVERWKKEITENRSVMHFLEGVINKQSPERGPDDMELEVVIDLTESNVETTPFYSKDVYQTALTRVKPNNVAEVPEDKLQNTIQALRRGNLPFYK